VEVKTQAKESMLYYYMFTLFSSLRARIQEGRICDQVAEENTTIKQENFKISPQSV